MFFDGNKNLYSESFFKRNDLINDYYSNVSESLWIDACNDAESKTEKSKKNKNKMNRALREVIAEMCTEKGKKNLSDALNKKIKEEEDEFNSTSYSMIKSVLDYLVAHPTFCFDDESLLYDKNAPIDNKTFCKVFSWLMKEGDISKSEYDNSTDDPDNPFENHIKAFMYNGTLIFARLMIGQGSSLEMWTSNRKMTKEESDFEHSIHQIKVIDDGKT